MSKKLLVIGWDAATESHLKKLNLPFYHSLKYRNHLAPEPYWQSREVDSGSAWTTLTTGYSMWDHNICTLSGQIKYPRLLKFISKFDGLIPRNLFNIPARIWARRISLGNQPTNNDITYKRIWHHIPNSLAFAVPLTYPPKPTNGITVSGFPSPNISVYPTDIEEEVGEKYSGEPERTSFDETGDYVDELFETHRQERDTVLWLNKEHDFQLQFIVFTLLDRLLHVVEEDDENIEKAYKKIDQTTAELVNEIEPDDVLIISDHGMKYDPRWKWKHIHDETEGIWASSHDFDLETHLDVKPNVLEYYGIDATDDVYNPPDSEVKTEEVTDRLEDLGYL